MSKYANDLDMMSQALIASLQKQLAECEREREIDEQRVADLMTQVGDLAKERDELAALNARMLVEYEARMKERDELVADAKRYRWLRSQTRPDDFYSGAPFWEVSYQANGMGQVMRNEKLDAAIDISLAKLGADKTGGLAP